MMKPRNIVATIINFVILKCIITNYALAQNGVCSLNGIGAAPNICDRSNYLVYVSESENGCRQTGTKCWCILIDNQNSDYDGDMMVELVQLYNRSSLRPSGHQLDEFKSYYTFKIISGINRFIVQLNPDVINNITSIKIRNTEICRLGNTIPFQQPTNNKISTISIKDESNRDYEDCIQRNTYTENSMKYCPTDRPEFMIEKRIALDNQTYWCININNDNNSLTSINHLQIGYSKPNQKFVYSPSDAYTDNGFMLGNRKTNIVISEQINQLADLNSVTIDNQTICSYFDQPVTIITPTTTTTSTTTPTTTTPSTPVTVTAIQPSAPPISVPKMPSIDDPPILRIDYPSNSNNFMLNCGIKSTHKNSLISFGSRTNPGDWPWQAAIFRLQLKTANRIFICGGTLISQKTVVTAAHCVVELNSVLQSDHLTVDLGRHDLLYASVGTQEYRVYDVIPHESYKPESFENDIAILILANYVQITRYINFICLPNPNEIIVHQVGKAVGWGRDENYQIQTDLKVATLPVIDHITCLTSNRQFYGKYLSSTNFCAGFANNTNLCSGDSGGGLVFKSQNKWFLGGITSLGVSAKQIDRECDTTQYVIFTDVTKFITWINKIS